MYGSCILFSYRVVSRRSRCYSSSSSKRLLEILANMPKPNSARIAEAQRQRQHISRKSEKYGPSTVYLQVLGSGAKGAPNTLYLFTDQKRYMFNCGECTQRLAHEHKVKLSKLDHIFITSKTWRNIGGLPGLSLTLQDVGVPNITLHGPDGLDELYNATKRFVIMKDMNVTMANCSPNVDFEDNVMNVKYVLLGPHEDLLTAQALKPHVKKPKPESATPERDYEEFIHDDTDYYKPERRNYKEKPKVKSSAEKADAYKKKNEKVLHELQKKTHCSIAFICTLKKRLGTLDLAKCVELGVKPGPMLGQLKSGQDVVLPDGSLVLSKDVKTPDDPGPVFIVLDVPDPTHLKEAEFQAHFNNGINPPENVPVLIVHFTPPHVFNHPKYIAFMSMFGPDTRHLVLNSKNTCLGSEAVHRTQHKLHLLDPDIFPLLRDVSMPAVWNSPPTLPKTNSPVRLKGLEELKNKIALAQFQNIINLEGPGKGDGGELVVEGQESNFKFEVLPGRTLTMFHLRPKRELDRSAEPKLHIQDYIEETMDADGFANSLQQFRRLVDALRYAKSDTQEYPKVVFLGTGSCIPSKTRNTSAIVVHIDENRSMLLDCGEGTLGQLVRFYGAKKVNAFLRTLQAIYISHLHADHHIGLIGVLQARRQALKEVQHQQRVPVLLFAPGQIVTWLTLYDQQFERIKNDYTLIPNQTLLEDEASRVELTAAELSAVGVHGVTTCLVAHCPNAFGVAIQINSQYKLTYSGDTLPCKELVRIGENSTLLIHEATMEDELVEEARLKMHSTTTQAIDIGRQMNARYTVLTHFSQRYARLPRLNANILNNNQSVGIAFDNMQITMSDLELLPHMYAPLQLMFAEHCVEMELKAAHRQSLRERRALSPPSEPSEPEWGSGGTSPVSKSQVRGSRPSSGSKSFTPQASYRESNSSRLRQELKGMAISGTIGKVPNLRSRSSSSARTTTQSPNRYPQYHQSRSDHAKQSRSPKASTGNESLDKKSPANKSPVNKSPVNKSPVHKSPVNKSPAHKSPVYKSAAHRSPANKSPDTMSLDNKCPDIKPPLSQSPDNKSPDNESSDNESPHNECPDNKSPDNKSPDNKSPDSKSPDLASTPRSVSQSSNLTKDHRQERPRPRCDFTETVINSRSKTLNSVPYRAVPQEVLVATAHGVTANSGKRTSFSNPPSPPTFAKPNDANAYGKPLVTSLNKKLMIRRQTTPQPTSPPRPSILRPNISYAIKTPTKESTSRDNKPKETMSTPQNKLPKKDPRKQKPEGRLSTPSSPIRSKSPISKPQTGTGKTSPVHTKRNETYNEMRPKPPTIREPASTIPNTTQFRKHSSRSFKPQLDDIKSSYLLLNKNMPDFNSKTSVNSAPKQSRISIPTHNVIDDEIRRQELMKVKKKFLSRKFWGDSKYDKIEGLNWISWK